MRHATQEGLGLIKRFEGFSSTVYICPAGYPTIGYGHLVRSGESFSEISEAEAEELLRKDVESAERAVLRLVNVPFTDGQFDALVSFTFNLGSGAFQRSALRRKVNRQAHAEVPEQLMRWVWAGGRKLNGLLKRRLNLKTTLLLLNSACSEPLSFVWIAADIFKAIGLVKFTLYPKR